MINDVMISQGRNGGLGRREWVRIHLQSDMEEKGEFLAWMTWWMVLLLGNFGTQEIKGQVLQEKRNVKKN